MSSSLRPRVALALVVAAVVIVSGCGGEEAETLRSTTTATPATTGAADGKVDEGGGDESGVGSWARTAGPSRGRIGELVDVDCDPDGEASAVWGTNVYTDDSSICTAAVHAGLITLADGGEVTFRLIPGEESYAGSSANGIDSSDYGSWGASFEFVEG